MKCKFLCRGCGKRSVIEVDLVTVIGDGADTVMYSLEIMCRRCGSHDVERVEPSEMELMLRRVGSAFREFEDVVFPEAVRAFGREMEFSKMLPFARKRAREEPDDPGTLVRLANVLRSMNRYDEAIPMYRKVLESHPDALEGSLHLGETYYNRWRFYKVRGAKGLARGYYGEARRIHASGKGTIWTFEYDGDIGELIASRLSELG